MLSLYLALPAFIAGIILLYKFSDLLVEGTSKTAAHFGISALVISLIIVAFGTSAPEFAISVGAAAQGEAEISLGNIVGSCVANLLLVLGVSALISPIKVKKSVVKREMPVMVISTLILGLFSFTGLLDDYHFLGGILFLIFFFFFVFYFYRCAKKEKNHNKAVNQDNPIKNLFFIFIGIAGVILGAWLLIESSKSIAEYIGVPTIIISLSMVAIGTSLPELVVSVAASYKKEADISIGNVLGSNVFNIFLVLGASALFLPLKTTLAWGSLIFLFFATFMMFPVIYTGYIISRKEGFVLLVLYSIFIWYIFFGSNIPI
ncbi:MAG: calcium/sodium antiporter [Candidatus Thermoplasmatota archaeon]